jgi:ferrous iron transport protein B
MNAEIKDKKWLFGGIGLQLGTGYTAGYLVYTVGTLITAPELLNVQAAVGGGLFVVAFASVLVILCLRSGKKVKTPCYAGGRR